MNQKWMYCKQILKYLRENNCPWDNWACAWAAAGGHLMALQYLRSEGLLAEPPREKQTRYHTLYMTWIYSDIVGHIIYVFIWTVFTGCSWDSKVCQYAVVYGHESVLKWARKNSCPWSEETRNRARDIFGYEEKKAKALKSVRWADELVSL